MILALRWRRGLAPAARALRCRLGDAGACPRIRGRDMSRHAACMTTRRFGVRHRLEIELASRQRRAAEPDPSGTGSACRTAG